MEAKQATLHHELIAQLLDSRIPKTEREHAAAREIERLRADILQELVDAPEPEPFGYFKSEPFGWTDCAETDDGAIALFAAPPAPSVPDGWRQFLTDVITAAGLLKYGKRDKGLAGRIGKFAFDAMRAATTPAEPPTDLPTWENGDDPLVSGGLIHRGVVDLAMNQLLETLK